jgi:beta-ureidopropionase
MNLNSNWMKDLRTEIFRHMYDEPVHPKNLWLHDEPRQHADVDEIYRANIGRLVDRGSFTRPAQAFPGARYIAPAESPGEAGWENIRELWSPPAEQ